MKVLVDCRYVRVGRHDGISRYTAGLVTELARLLPVELLVSDERQLAHLPDLPWHLISSPTSWREPFVAPYIAQLSRGLLPIIFRSWLNSCSPLIVAPHRPARSFAANLAQPTSPIFFGFFVCDGNRDIVGIRIRLKRKEARFSCAP